MIYIYSADSNQVRSKTNLIDLLSQMPENMHDRANRYKFEEDAFDFMLGRLLLQRGLSDLEVDEKLEDIAYRESGKPFLKNIYFNISHTEDLVVCALSEEAEIGVDIEKVKQIKLSDFEAWFTKTEWIDIHKSATPLQRFYWYWTRKESILKAMGVDLSYLNQIEIDASQDHFLEKEEKWYLKDLEFGKNYVGALCAEVAINELIYKSIEL